ncbi:MAG: AMP-binding protein [Burkholderiaceae bacterium]|nr:AMP-binding protein [Burkholderiaceae bacterium]
MRIIDFFDRGASLYPHRICLKDEHGQWTFDQVRRMSHRAARALHARGIQVGDRIAVYSPNAAIAFAAVLAIFRAGGVWLPVNVRNPLPETIEYLTNNDCAALFFGAKYEAQAREIRATLPGLKHTGCLDAAFEHAPDFLAWCEAQDDAPLDADVSNASVAIIKSTGGTTGKPKSVMISHRNFATMVANFLACMPHDAPPVNLVAVPMTHGAGNIALALLALGATLVFMERADTALILKNIETERVSTMFLPPTVIYSLLSHPDARKYDYASLRYMIYSAAPMSVDKLGEALDLFGPVMAQAFGQTEAPLLCTFMGPKEHILDDPEALRKRLSSCGRATPFTRVAIMDDHGRLLGDGEVGEIVVRGDMVMLGYHDNPAETEAASRFGWHHTGDVGMRDADGYFYIVDRKKDMIISGGFNIYPSEIEQVLWSHPAVQDCAVIGVPDPKWGEAVVAIVELKSAQSVTEQALSDYCRDRLGGMKTPKRIEFWQELPRSPVGKVLKRDIREKFWQGQSRRV